MSEKCAEDVAPIVLGSLLSGIVLTLLFLITIPRALSALSRLATRFRSCFCCHGDRLDKTHHPPVAPGSSHSPRESFAGVAQSYADVDIANDVRCKREDQSGKPMSSVTIATVSTPSGYGGTERGYLALQEGDREPKRYSFVQFDTTPIYLDPDIQSDSGQYQVAKVLPEPQYEDVSRQRKAASILPGKIVTDAQGQERHYFILEPVQKHTAATPASESGPAVQRKVLPVQPLGSNKTDAGPVYHVLKPQPAPRPAGLIKKGHSFHGNSV